MPTPVAGVVFPFEGADYGRHAVQIGTSFAFYYGRGSRDSKTLAHNPQFVKTRLLGPSKPGGLRKDFFNPNVVAGFDKF